ncbi:MAG: Ig-like domain repeat protein [Candidatus Bathyarchaeota archaeon]|nr:MAG: Ig-like domain repeat protein [Candidatus Bathyarchaeota archaeon]
MTPDALEPIAEDLWNIYGDEEDFANGVLMVLHQIPYNESDRRFPVETIVENQGDCDTFSYVAASIMLAGGLDVVLLYYEDERHMNVGVSLLQSPQDARSAAHYFSFEGKNYYVAECTGGNWQDGWRVGECPPEFESASAAVVTLEGCEQGSPGQVSSSYDSPTSSSISLVLSSMYVVRGSRVLISGSLSPPRSHRNITVYVRSDSSWSLLKVLVTDENGMYSSTWEPSSAGVYQIMASWSGDSEYASAESNVCTLVVTNNNWMAVVVVAAAVIGVVMVAALLARESKSIIVAPPE